MRAIKSKDSKPELLIRRLIYALGYRYRLHRKELPGCPDLVFSSRQKVIFIHGCFWHGHHCKRGARMPKENSDYWCNKIAKNVQRDKKHLSDLRHIGWDVLVLWECDLKDTDAVKRKVVRFLA